MGQWILTIVIEGISTLSGSNQNQTENRWIQRQMGIETGSGRVRLTLTRGRTLF